MRIQEMPAAFCKARCNAWSNKYERCNSRRWQDVCDHPEATSEAWKYKEKAKA